MNTIKSPKRLYKYRSFNVHTLRMLTDAEVYYANPDAFNDPLDTRPSLQIDTDLARLEELLHRMIFQHEGENKANRIIENHRYMSTEYGDFKKDVAAARYLKQVWARDVLEILRKNLGLYGVFSLAEKWDCPLMWSHYANEHRGICVEYDAHDHAFERLEPVNYRKPRSIKVSDLIDWIINRSESAEQEVFRTYFLAKAPQWRYEREWRDIKSEFGVDAAPARLSAVYFGLRCDDSVVTALVKLHSRTNHPVKFYRVRADENSFRLRRTNVDVDEIVACGLRPSASLEFRDGFEMI